MMSWVPLDSCSIASRMVASWMFCKSKDCTKSGSQPEAMFKRLQQQPACQESTHGPLYSLELGSLQGLSPAWQLREDTAQAL